MVYRLETISQDRAVERLLKGKTFKKLPPEDKLSVAYYHLENSGNLTAGMLHLLITVRTAAISTMSSGSGI